MRSALALYALRFGGWLLAKSSRSYVSLTVDLYDRTPDEGPVDLPAVTLSREYGA